IDRIWGLGGAAKLLRNMGIARRMCRDGWLSLRVDRLASRDRMFAISFTDPLARNDGGVREQDCGRRIDLLANWNVEPRMTEDVRAGSHGVRHVGAHAGYDNTRVRPYRERRRSRLPPSGPQATGAAASAARA